MMMWFCCVTSVQVSLQWPYGWPGPQRDCCKYMTDVQHTLRMKSWEMLEDTGFP